MIISVKVKPNSKSDTITITPEGMLTLRIKAPPVDGKANAYLIKYLSTILKIPRSSIEIIQGESSSLKRIMIEGDEGILKEKLAAIINKEQQ